jgi:hypothetical protein
MSHLSDESRALVDAARDGDEPSVDDRMRVRRRLLQLGVVASVTTVASATAAASAAGGAGAGAGAGSVATGAAASIAPAPLAAGGAVVLGPGVVSTFGAIAVKVVVGVALLGSVGVVGVKGVSTYRAHQAETVSMSHVAAAPPAHASEAPALNPLPPIPDVPPLPPAAPVAEAEPAHAPAAVNAEPVHTRSARHAAVTTEAPSTTELEFRLLVDAEKARQGGNPEHALRLLDEHNARFPYGELAAEEAAQRILTLCDLGRGVEAKANARAFLAEYPRHPSAEKVRASCARLSQP